MAPDHLPDDVGDEKDKYDADAGESHRPAEPGVTRPPGYRSLDAFASGQRHLAALDFSAVHAAQRALSQSVAATNLSAIRALQEAVTKDFAKTIHFSLLAPLHEALLKSDAVAAAVAAQSQWAQALSRAIDVPALERANQAIVASGVLRNLSDSSQAILESLRSRVNVGAEFYKAFQFELPKLDVSGFIAALGRWIPTNLRHTDLDRAAALALDEGLPLSWIPRSEIVTDLLAVDSADERLTILRDRRGDILDDCEGALADIDHEWARQCLNAARALRAGFDAPAQSHAANIIDSVVLDLHGRHGRERSRERAKQELDELPLRLAAENLTIRPLFRAFTTWWPSSNMALPEHFARHATAHAVGHPDVFEATSALVAVMLATSLTVQYSPDPPGPPEASQSTP
jgi:hypothetical protein